MRSRSVRKLKDVRMRCLVALAMAGFTVVLSSSLGAAQPASAAPAATYVPISGAGSTWSYNAIHAWVTNVAQYGMVVNYAAVGSTSGRQQFAQGTVDWGASEIPYGVRDGNNYDPPPARGYAYMPDTAGGTTFMYNLKIGTTRVTNLRLSGAAIAGIFTGVITQWNNPIIAKDNPGLTLPAIKIVPVVRSDGSGATAEFTQWIVATEGSYWSAYCAKVGRSPCTQTSAYPVLPGSAMVGQPGDLGVAGYVSQSQADGAIGYVEYSYAKETGFPVAKVLNAAGYYTEPTPGHVAVSLLKAQINMNQSSPLYLTQDLSQVYSDTDRRTYELSSYSYMILPTDLSQKSMTTAKGYTLGAFGAYLLCQGQEQVDALGYSALPINLVEDGYAQLQKVPGNNVPTATSAIIQSCHNPTFSANGTNTLANTDPYPPACDKQGTTQCTTGTGGATTPTPVKSTAAGGTGSSPSAGTTSSAAAGASGAASSSGAAAPACDPNTGSCVPAAGSGQAVAQEVNGTPTAASASLGDGNQVTLMVLAATLLLGLALVPPLIAQASRRGRRRGGPGSSGDLGDFL
jgi:phosphate ABC transporter phosphate-binding protein